MATENFASLEDLNQWLADHHMTGFWQSAGRSSDEVSPNLWKWGDISRALLNAGQLVPMEMVAMRTIQLKNPGLGVGMTRTLHFSVQCLMPGERTKAHRNLVSESRFVLQAPKGATFIVDGEEFPMEPGDLVTTPNWSWHDHYNGGDEPAIWLDGMDTRLVNTIVKGLNERFPQDHQPIEKPRGFSARTLGRARVLNPSTGSGQAPSTGSGQARSQGERVPPPLQYKWSDTEATFAALAESEEADACDGIRLTYANPLTGGPTYPTYACEIQLLPRGFSGSRHRHNSTAIYHAFRGQGVTAIDGERFQWSQGDIFIVPPWTWHEHQNPGDSDAILYSITDRPAAIALGLYGEEEE